MTMFEKLRQLISGIPAAKGGAQQEPPPDPIADAQAAITEEKTMIDEFSSSLAASFEGVAVLRKDGSAIEEEIAKFDRLKDAAAHRNDPVSVEEAIRMRLEAEGRLTANREATETVLETQHKLQHDLKAAETRIETAKGQIAILRAQQSGARVRTKIADDDIHAQEVAPGATSLLDGASRQLDETEAKARASEEIAASGRQPEVNLTDDNAVAQEVKKALEAAGH